MSMAERSMKRGFRHRAPQRSTGDLGPVRRIVTGFDEAGRASIQSDGIPPHVYTMPDNGPTIYEIWSTRETPARLAATGEEPLEERLMLAPPKDGTRIRVLDILPEGLDHASSDDTSVRVANGSIDYCIVLMGEMTLILEGTETVVRTGDIVVQRGTRHAWANRSGRLCRVAFILVDARYDAG
jgi:hypothetical protein